MFAELFTWWTRQMADLGEPVSRRIQATAPDAMLVEPGTVPPSPTGTLRILRRRRGRITRDPGGDVDDVALPDALARRRRNEPLILALPGPLLHREVELPAAAATTLGNVLRYEMDRLTPFSAADVFFTFRVLGHDRVRHMLRVELAIIPKAPLQPWLDRLRNAGVMPSALEAPGHDGVVRRISFAEGETLPQARIRRGARVEFGLCGALACAAIALPLLRQSLALDAVDQGIAALRPRMQQVEALRQRIAAGTAGAGQIAAARQRAAETLQVLGLLTDTMPDDTWLISLTLRKHQVALEGHSAAATKLIATMAHEPNLRNPAFSAPVLRGDNGGEAFSIQAEYVP